MNTPHPDRLRTLADDVMKTDELDAFFDDVETKLTAQMTSINAAPVIPQKRGTLPPSFWILASLIGLGLLSFVVWTLTASGTDPVNVTTTGGTAVSTSTEPSSNPVVTPLPPPTTLTSAAQKSVSDASPVDTSAALSAKTVKVNPDNAGVQNRIDSLAALVKTATVPIERSRLSYQIGINQREIGANTEALATLQQAGTVARTSGALTLAARCYAEAARAAKHLGRKGEARTLLQEAVQIAPASMSTTVSAWRAELDRLDQ